MDRIKIRERVMSLLAEAERTSFSVTLAKLDGSTRTMIVGAPPPKGWESNLMNPKANKLTTFTEFALQFGLTLKSQRTSYNPQIPLEFEMDHWRVILKCGGRQMSFIYSKGHGHDGEPPILDEVLLSLVQEIPADCENFEGWCMDQGTSPEDPTARHAFEVSVKQMARLRSLLGSPEAFDALIRRTEHY